MKKITLLLGFLSLFLFFNTVAQKIDGNNYQTGTNVFVDGEELHRCGTQLYFDQKMLNDPAFKARWDKFQSQTIEPAVNEMKMIGCTASNTVRVPLAFHFDNSFDCSDANCILSKIDDAIATLNIDFGDNRGSSNVANCPSAYADVSSGTCIEFYLAAPPACSGLDVNCDGAITIGQFAGGYSGGGNGAGACWDDYLNVFVQSPQSGNLGVADQIPDALPADGPGEGVSLGSPYFGGLGGPCGTIDTDGTYNLGKTLAHEIGHYLGLFHTFQGGCGDEPNNTYNGTNITVNDTPAQQSQFFGCPTGCVSSGCGGNQQTANIMNYTDDACMDIFTEDQAFAMNVVANQLFGGLNIPEASPDELYGACTGNACVLVCPASVNTPINLSETFCGESTITAFPNPETSGLVLDDNSDAVYFWTLGNYASAAGAQTVVANPTVLTSQNCAIETVTYYLNVDCGNTPFSNANMLNGGTFTVTVYPAAPDDLTALVTITNENTCTEPIVTPIGDCANFISVTAAAGNPSFPVVGGQSGTATYDVTFIPDAAGPDCCAAVALDNLVSNGDFEAGTASWTEVEEVPSGTTNPNPFGVIGVSNGALNGTNDAWFGGWGSVTGGSSVLSSTISITQNITIPETCTTADLTFDYGIVCAGNATIVFDVIVGGVTVGTLDCASGSGSFSAEILALGAPTGTTTITLIGVEDDPNPRNSDDAASAYIDNISIVSGGCPTSACSVPVTANYNCTTTTCNSTASAANNPTEACSAATIDVCVDVVGDVSEVTLNAGGASTVGTTGTQVCAAVTLNANQTCGTITQNLTFSANCANGDELVPLTNLTVTIYPETLSVTTLGDGTCGTLSAQLVSADGENCGAAQTFACSEDGETLNYDFSGALGFTPLAACPQTGLSGTLTCGACNIPCAIDAPTVIVGACNDNGTNDNAADDTFTFDLTVTAVGASASYVLSGGPATDAASGTNAYSTTTTYGPFNIADWVAGSTVTLTVTDSTDGTCTNSFDVLVPATCSVPVTNGCSSSAGSTTSGPLCEGETYDITINNQVIDAATPDFLILYTFDPTINFTQQQIYDDLTATVDDDNLQYFGENTTTGLTGLEGWTNVGCDFYTLGFYVVPYNATDNTINFSCAIEGPVTFDVYPIYSVVVTNDATCTPTASLQTSDGTVCATSGDTSTNCSADAAYDFTSNIAVGTPANCTPANISGTLTCTCNCANPATVSVDAAATICENETLDLTTVNAVFGGGATSATWTTSGDGTLTGTTYTPGTGDIAAGTVILTYTTNDPDGTGTLCQEISDELTLSIIPTPTANIGGLLAFCQDGFTTLTASGGSTYLWSTNESGASINVSVAGTYSVTAIAANGCTDVAQVVVNEFPATVDLNETYVGCEGDNYTFTSPSNTIYNEGNPTGTETLQDINGCDYTVTVDLTFNALTADVNETYVGCAGDGYTFASPSGTVYNETNPNGTETIQDANGCDYTVTVDLTFNTLTADINETYVGCSGDGYAFTSPSGTVYNETNPNGTETLQDANGCDYDVTVNLTFNALTADINETYEGCSGDGYTFTSPSGTVYNETNPNGTETLQDANGCDYTVTVDLTFNALTADINEIYVGCAGDGYTFASPSGTVYNETNPNGTETIQDVNGCDYTVTVDLTFNALTADINETYVGCSGDGYSYTSPSGIVYNESNKNGIETLQDANGCDYDVTVNLTFNALTADINETYEGCSGDGYTFTSPSGTVYNETNPNGTETLQDANGCDYTVTVDLTFNALTADVNETYVGCLGDGYTYTSPSGTVYNGANPNGTVYNGANPNGTETIQDANGCDYTVTVDLTFNALTADINETYVGCSGDGYSYTSPSGTIYNEGNKNGIETLQDANGCDYDVTVNLTFNALTADIVQTNTSCEGSGYTYTSPSGTVYNEANPNGTEVLQNSNGCDYTVIVDLTFEVCVDPCQGVVDQNIDYVGCSGDGYTYTSPSGIVYNETNPTGIENLTDGNGCTFVANIDLVFNELTNDVDFTEEGCADGGLTFTSPSGTIYNESNPSGIEVLQDANGCNYTVTVDLTFNALTADINETYVGCSGDGYFYTSPSGTIYNEGNKNGTETLQDANGCDYDVTVNLTFNALTADIVEIYVGCVGDGYSYTSPSGTIYNESNPSGTEVLQDANGCDYSVTVDLTFSDSLPNVEETYVGCSGDGYTYVSPNGTVYNESNPTGFETVVGGGGCTYTVSVNLIFNATTPNINISSTECSGSGFTYTSPSGLIYDESNPSGIETLQDANGCDYNVTVNLIFNSLLDDIDQTYTGCAGDGYTYIAPGGIVFNEANPTGTLTLQDANGCDYLLNVDLTFNAVSQDITETYVGCAGDGYTFTAPNGVIFNQSNPSGNLNLTDDNGCTYNVEVDLTFNTVSQDIVETYIGCVGDGYSYTSPSGTVYNENNKNGTETLQDANGCDYDVTVNLTFNALTADIVQTNTSCEGSGYSYISPSGTVYNEANPNGTEVLQNNNGCDYTVTVDLNFETCVDPCENVQNQTSTYSGCSGDGYTIIVNGTTYNEANPNGTELLVDGNGCTYTFTVDLNFIAATPDTFEEFENCSGNGFSYTSPNGTIYNESNTSGVETLLDTNGCTYLLVIDLFFYEPSEDITEAATLCAGESYTASTGTIYTSSGSETLTDANGCTYELFVILTFEDCSIPEIGIFDPCYCDNPNNFEVNGEQFVEDHITISSPAGQTWITTSTTGLVNADGTPFTGTITAVENSNTGLYDIYIFYNPITGYSITVMNENNEELSIGASNLTQCVKPEDITVSATECEGSGYTYTSASGTVYSEANPTGTEVITNDSNCEAELTVALVFEDCTDPCALVEPISTNLGTICFGESVEYNGITYNETGSTVLNLENGNGCAYTETITLLVLEQSPDLAVDLVACEGESVEYAGLVFDANNIAAEIESVDANGCTYTEFIAIGFFPSTNDVQETGTYCEEDGYTFTSLSGTVYDINNANGTETLIDENGCSYELVVDLTFEACNSLFGSISSVVYLDSNGNGVQDEGELGISGAEVFIVFANGTIDVVVTDINGAFTFDDLAAGIYEVVVGSVPGFEITTVNTFTVDLQAGENYEEGDKEFGFAIIDNPINCADFAIDYVAECSDDGSTFTVTVSVTGFDAEDGYIVSSSNPVLNGTNFTSETFVDGPYPVGVGFDYQISPSSDASCVQEVSVSEFSCTVTAIELLEFTGRKLDNSNILSWTTASEIDNDYFTLERSFDGVNFETIAEVKGQGTTNTTTTYNFTDVDIKAGVMYYRLLATDLDAVTKEVSEVIALSRAQTIANIYPIPTSNMLNVDLVSPKYLISINVFNVTGQIVKQLSFEQEMLNISINVQDLPVGVYYLELQEKANISTTKFVKE